MDHLALIDNRACIQESHRAVVKKKFLRGLGATIPWFYTPAQHRGSR